MRRIITERFAIDALSALAQSTRLKVFRTLVNCFPDELAAGEIALACKTPHNTMSTHLAILARARLIEARKEGRMVHYRAHLDGFQTLLGFLLTDCCNGRAEVCAPLVADLTCCTPLTTAKKKAHG